MKATAIYVPAARPCDSHCRLSAYDAQSRRTGIASGDYAASVGYANGKASTLGWQERTTSYTYRPGLNQLSGFTTPGTSTARTFEYDAQHRLTEIKLNGQLSTGYTLNDKDQRIRVESEDGSYWKFRYDGKSQVTAMERRRAGEEEQVTPGLYYGGFSYDDIGNWTETSRTGNTYYYLTSNILNQYTDVSTVWPMNTWNPTYDVDGNMLTGIMGWSYGWNGENRLISAENGDTRLEFSYDYMGRRFEKKVYTANVLTKHEKFVYDGYKLIQVLDALNSDAVTMAFAWHPESTGLDTPFSMTYDGETYYYVTDGNKNVMSLIDAAGTKVAEYVYDPFGRLLSSTGELAEINPFRFSSEYHDDETGLVYYNYRYYSPELGRWISRDPIEEEGGVNLYAMVGNNPVSYWDRTGLDRWYYDQLHMVLAVDYWADDCSEKVGVMYIEFGPDHSAKTLAASIITLSIYTPAVVKIHLNITKTVPGKNIFSDDYTPPDFLTYKSSVTPSCCKADMKLKNWAFEQKYRVEKGKIFYNWAFYNCRHFVYQGLKIGLE